MYSSTYQLPELWYLSLQPIGAHAQRSYSCRCWYPQHVGPPQQVWYAVCSVRHLLIMCRAVTDLPSLGSSPPTPLHLLGA